ncbi:MAG TPA: uroporphyrinogen decarboxylase family protein [Opitutaceae bacterium]|nr:uroporphyrinogen decarboxylase family protein [Opitutaceae bacterium]
MNSRERVHAALAHEEPDLIPVTLAYENPEDILKRYGKSSADLPSMRQDVMRVSVELPAFPSSLADRYFEKSMMTGDYWIDPWGVLRCYQDRRRLSYAAVGPLRRASSAEEILNFPWPELGDHRAALIAETNALQRSGYAVQGAMSQTIFEHAWLMCGMENLLMKMHTDPDFVQCLFTRIATWKRALARQYVEAGVDILRLGDDIASQHGMMMAPKMWRGTLKPLLAEIIADARESKPALPIFYHSDGNIRDVIDDLIEIGVTILNPVQPEAMDPLEVKKRYGDKLTLWGCVGVQRLFPFGTPAEMDTTVRDYCRILGKGGGFVIGPTHSIESDIPWENIVAFYKAVEKYG